MDIVTQGSNLSILRLVLSRHTWRHYREESGSRTRSPETWSGSVLPSLACIITNIAGTARHQSRKLLFLLGSGHWFQRKNGSNCVS